MRIPAHIDPRDTSPSAHRDRAAHAQRMMNLRPNGNGFRRIPDNSAQMSIVEKHLVAAGDMAPAVAQPSKRKAKRLAAERAYLIGCQASPRRAQGGSRRSQNPAFN